MSTESHHPTRRAVLGTCGVMGLATLLAVGAAGTAHADADGFPFARTNDIELRADDPTLSRRARELIRIGDVGIVQGDSDALTAFFHPDFRFHGPAAELNRQQLWDYFAACRAAFDDFSVSRQFIMSDGGDYLAVRTRFAGVFTRPFSGSAGGPLQPNGKSFEYRLINVFRYAPNGQLIEEWVQYDVQAFLDQLQSP
jgi:predicted ester cyclase